MAFRTANPALNDKAFEGLSGLEKADTMTIDGVVNRTGLLLVLIVIGAAWTWSLFFGAATPAAGVQAALPWAIGGLIGGLIFSLITIFKKTAAPLTAPLYALAEGLLLGGVSVIFEMRHPGIVLQAVGATFSTLAGLLLAYKTGLIRATENFKLGVFAATMGIGMLYLVSFVMGFFGHRIGFIHESSWIGIGFTLFVVIIAAANLVLDFDFVERGCENKAPKFMEWYAAFGLVVTLVWLYIELLRLISKLRDRK